MPDTPTDIMALTKRVIAECAEDWNCLFLMPTFEATWEDEARALRIMGWKFRKRKRRECGLEGVPYRRLRDMAAEKRKKAAEFPVLHSLLDLEST